MIIEDPRTGIGADVLETGQLSVNAVTTSVQMYSSVNHSDSFQAYTGPITVTTAGMSHLLVLYNSSAEDTFIITHIKFSVDAVETQQVFVEIGKCDGFTGGTEITPVNMNIRSIRTTTVSAYKTYTSCTNFVTFDGLWIKGPGFLVWNSEGSLVLNPGSRVSLRATTSTDGATITGRMSFFQYNLQTEEE